METCYIEIMILQGGFIIVAAKKYKRMTNKEKELNKKIRNDLREKGIIPPVKPRLNRNKFAKEVMEEMKSFVFFSNTEYLIDGISCMLPSPGDLENRGRISDQHIVMLKVLKIAIESKKYKENLAKQGIKNYKVAEFYDQVIKPIIEL